MSDERLLLNCFELYPTKIASYYVRWKTITQYLRITFDGKSIY